MKKAFIYAMVKFWSEFRELEMLSTQWNNNKPIIWCGVLNALDTKMETHLTRTQLRLFRL